MGRAENRDGQIALFQGAENEADAIFSGTDVNVNHTGFIGQNAALTGCKTNFDEFIVRNAAGAVIRNGHFNADDLLNQDNIAGDGSADGRGGQHIGAGIGEATQAFFVETLAFGQHIFDGTGAAVCAQKAAQRRHAALHNCGKLNRRNLIGKAAFATAAGDMNVLINIGRNQQVAPGVPDRTKVPGKA